MTFLNWGDGVTAEIERDFEREFRVDFSGLAPDEFLPWLEQNGKMPLPPYLKRPATKEDSTRYQTVFAKTAASVAAPTAGLHFTPELLSALESQGVHTARVTLEIGYGTFAPIHAETLDTHQMHSETYLIPKETQNAVELAQREGRRVIAVGTTSLRALESWDTVGPKGSTSIFIKPGHTFKRVDGLITNFHLPESTLLILVCAFLGKEATLSAYTEAVQEGYRFFSYGDAMAILP